MNVTNRLSEDVKIFGTLIASEDLFLDCELEGEIKSSGNITIGDNSKVTGKINANNVIVFGVVEGDINSKEKCELKDSSKIVGNIVSSTLKVVEGSNFAGNAKISGN